MARFEIVLVLGLVICVFTNQSFGARIVRDADSSESDESHESKEDLHSNFGHLLNAFKKNVAEVQKQLQVIILDFLLIFIPKKFKYCRHLLPMDKKLLRSSLKMLKLI